LFSDPPKKSTNTLRGQNVELLNVKLMVHILTTGIQRVKMALQKIQTTDRAFYSPRAENFFQRQS